MSFTPGDTKMCVSTCERPTSPYSHSRRCPCNVLYNILFERIVGAHVWETCFLARSHAEKLSGSMRVGAMAEGGWERASEEERDTGRVKIERGGGGRHNLFIQYIYIHISRGGRCNMYIYTYIYLLKYMCTYVYVYIYIYICIYTYIYINIYIHIYIYIYIYIYTELYMYMYMYMYVYVRV